ncbi:hypothetical protein XU18_3025 [Perkinsela sp. CCAP 1560/4]|nr:hypothetical protein XU18_3025 [Perkinsela sp. CCAP 1560/4]|eukprot:KNH06088.1 hypothetical protein XU18_3025 [Perkinsela sp. CCAP 1560/4]
MNYTPGVSVYGEKKVQVKVEDKDVEYRIWNPYRSKLAASIYNGIEKVYIGKGSKVLYLGAASGTTVSHVSDIVGSEGIVYAVEFSKRCGRDLEEMSRKRNNIVPIIEDARHPWKYRMLIYGFVDSIFMDVAQPDQARIIALNARYFLKPNGGFCASIKASCVDSTEQPEAIFAAEAKQLQKELLKPKEQVTLEPFERGHAMITGIYKGNISN